MQQHDPQEFDVTLKALFGNEAQEILPRLIPEVELIDDKNIEIGRTILKADLVYTIHYRGEPHILDMELQTGADSKIDIRVLQYHVGLLAQHKKPVITVILYPFETTIPKPPYQEMSGSEVLLALYYRVLALWKLDAHKFVRERAICMYTLLPAMQGANAPMLIQALYEMQAHYTHQQFGNHLIRFKRIVERSTTLTDKDKEQVKEEISMYMEYDWFIDQNPDVQERVARGEERGVQTGLARGLERGLERGIEKGLEKGLEQGLEKGIEKGQVQGRLQGLQMSALKVVRTRFPALLERAQTRIVSMGNQEELDHLIDQLLVATDEASAQQLFL